MVSRVVRAIPGLQGWVGIDYIDDGSSVPIVLEVNPRPTTSLVAFLSLLDRGMLAEAWLGQYEGPSGRFPAKSSHEFGQKSDSRSRSIPMARFIQSEMERDHEC